MKRYLVVANQTAAGPALQQTVRELISEGPCSFLLVVPATHPKDHRVWTEGTAYGLARRRLDEAMTSLRSAGAEITGWVGDENPYRAVQDALADHDADEVIFSTFPRGISRWLRMDVAGRIERDLRIAVRVVESEKLPVSSGT